MKLFLHFNQSGTDIVFAFPEFNNYLQVLSANVFKAIFLFMGMMIFAYAIYIAFSFFLALFGRLSEDTSTVKEKEKPLSIVQNT